MNIELILGIQTLCAWHGKIGAYYLNPDHQTEHVTGICPSEYIKLHTLCRDELRYIIHELGVDYHQEHIDFKRPLKRPVDHIKSRLGFPVPPHCYGALITQYQNILSLRPLPALIEIKLFEQLYRLQCFVDEFKMDKTLAPGEVQHPLDKRFSARPQKLLAHV